ncbi:MAG: ABC transporter permease, partial [Acidimicrobiales bacterium]
MTDIASADLGLALPRPRWPRRLLGLPTAVAGLGLTAGTVAVAALAGVLAPGDPFATVAEPFLAPSTAHPMGTDDLGRDLLHAVVHGARTSMIVVVGVVVVSTALGIAVGLAAGYGGRLADEALMRLTDMFQAVPRFFLAILAVALFGPGTANLIIILAVTSWPQLARVVRAETRSLKQRPFVDAARVLGATDRRVLARHVVPHLLPSVMVLVSLTAGRVILLEASLGFLGLGDPNAMSWGYLANNAQRFLRTAWWMSFFPGAAIILAVLGFTLLSDAVTDLHDPFTAGRRVRPVREAGRRRTVRWLVPAGAAALAAVVGVLALSRGDGARVPPQAGRPA